VPEGCVVESVTLQLYAASAKPRRTLQVFRITQDWLEREVTWRNQPPTGGEPAETRSGLGYRQWDVTSQVEAMYDAGSAYGFLIRDKEESRDAEQSFHSREKREQVPLLNLRFTAAPIDP